MVSPSSTHFWIAFHVNLWGQVASGCGSVAGGRPAVQGHSVAITCRLTALSPMLRLTCKRDGSVGTVTVALVILCCCWAACTATPYVLQTQFTASVSVSLSHGTFRVTLSLTAQHRSSGGRQCHLYSCAIQQLSRECVASSVLCCRSCNVLSSFQWSLVALSQPARVSVIRHLASVSGRGPLSERGAAG